MTPQQSQSVFLDRSTSITFATRAACMTAKDLIPADPLWHEFCGNIARTNMEQVHCQSESPIETTFWASLVMCFAFKNPIGLKVVLAYPNDDYFSEGLYETFPYMKSRLHLRLQPEMECGGSRIRPDGLLWVPGDPTFRRVIVECDGFEFHSSKSSFIADRKRDRSLQELGYEVLRYSGSEIYAYPITTSISLARRLLARKEHVQ